MKVLAADTGTAVLSIAALDDDVLLAESVVLCGRAHSERLLATLEWILNETGLALAEFDLLAIGIGPGSFTGLRVGVSAWKGLALGAGKPLAGVPSLQAFARHTPGTDAVIAPLLDARMHEVFGAAYRMNDGAVEIVTPPRVGPIEAHVADLPGGALCFGDGADLYADRIRSANPSVRRIHGVAPRASHIGYEALHMARRGDAFDPGAVEPVYLRKSQAEENLAQAAP